MRYALKDLTADWDEQLLLDETLQSSHERVRSMWPFPLRNVDMDASSRLAWREGDKVITYTWNGQDVLILAPRQVLGV
jgi:hypothetical protein